MEKPIYVVNVFSESGMSGGNQLGVVLEAGDLTKEQMQIIAKQMNYSETTFITDFDGEHLSFRIFIPDDEIPFAGHPIIGTSYLNEYLNRREQPRNDSVTARIKSGDIRVNFSDDVTGALDLIFLTQLPVTYHGDFAEIELLLKALNVEPSDLISTSFPIFTPADLKFIVVTLQHTSIIDQVRPDLTALGEVLEDDQCVVIIAPDEEVEFNSRMFAPNHSIDEDPATGSAQNAIIHSLDKLGLLPDKEMISIKQGYAMGRPSLLYNKVNREDDKLNVQTGGRTAIILKGSIFVD